MSDFYTSLVEHYDSIFPPESDIVSFLETSMEGRRKLLDIACGTGTYALELASRGFNVTGIDLEERMIEIAKEKTLSAGRTAGPPEFYVADMTGSSKESAGVAPVFSQSYDGVYCIGNSLPHLGTIEEVEKALSVWHSALEPGGAIILQIVNFARFISESFTELPSIKRDALVFSRRYIAVSPARDAAGPVRDAPAPAAQSVVDFEGTLTLNRTGQIFKNTVRLLVIDRELLEKALRKAGFRDLEFFGCYDGEAYDEKASFLLICRALAG